MITNINTGSHYSIASDKEVLPESYEVAKKPSSNVFWMNYASGCGAPTCRHNSKSIAKGEADRLSKSLRRDVYVLQAVGVAHPPVPQPPNYEDIC